MSHAMESSPIYKRRMGKEYAFFRWVTKNNISGVIYSLTLMTEAAAGFTDFLPFYEYMVKLVDTNGEPIDMKKFEESYPDKKDPEYQLLKQVVKPLRTVMATDEFNRSTPPKIGDKVELVFRANSSPNAAEQTGLNAYLLKARRVME